MPAEKENDEDVRFMRAAIREARKGIGLTAPNPPVGAVIAKAGKIIGRGWHRKAGEPHAEVEAIRSAQKRQGKARVKGATIYVTLEPCSTHGRTPPCTDAILEAGLQRVVFGISDPNPAHVGRASKVLKAKGISTSSGILRAECLELIRPFRKLVNTGLPWLISKCALSLDGRITRPPGQSQWITGQAARDDVQQLRSQVDAILIGGNTARTDNPKLTVRGRAARRRSSHPNPWRVVMTRQEELPAELHLLTDEWKFRTLIFRNQSLRRVLRNLGRKGCLSVLLESGGNLTGQALKAGFVDEVIWYIAPTILGAGVASADLGESLPGSWKGANLEEMKVSKIGPDLKVQGRISR